VRGLPAWFLLFATAPFVLTKLTADDADFTHAAWGFAIYFALIWGLAIHTLVRPEPVSRWLVAKVVATVAVVGTMLAVVLERAIGSDTGNLFWAVFGVGVPEEVAKALPIVLFMLLAKHSWTTRMYLFMGAVAGLTFGVIEAVGYSSLYQLVGGGSGTATTLIIWRLLADGLFHGCCAAVSAYFVGLAWWRRDQRWQLVTVGVAVAALLHGVYDRWATSWAGTTTAVVIVLLFVAYVRAGDEIVHQLASDGTVHELPPGELPGEPSGKEGVVGAHRAG
jgi:RsiW-degrading membrane proteinase PrsW (M82 family)